MNAIEVDGVAKVFASRLAGPPVRALAGVTLRVPQGEIVGLLGPNGSGKSTLLKIILGLLESSAGECRIFGVPSTQAEARLAVGYLPEAPGFPPHLTGYEWTCYQARLSGLPRAGLAERVEQAIGAVGLAAAMRRRAGTYSYGMRQRLGLAQALVHDPRLLILDEPMAGLDPVGTAETGRWIRAMRAEGRTVLFTSHLLGQVMEICDRIALLNHGRLVLDGRVDELTRQHDQTALLVDRLPAAITEELRAWLQARGVRLHGMEEPRCGLERVFLEAVRADDSQSPSGP